MSLPTLRERLIVFFDVEMLGKPSRRRDMATCNLMADMALNRAE